MLRFGVFDLVSFHVVIEKSAGSHEDIIADEKNDFPLGHVDSEIPGCSRSFPAVFVIREGKSKGFPLLQDKALRTIVGAVIDDKHLVSGFR